MEENNRKETMESLFDEESLGVVRRGTLVKGKVVGVGQQDVFVDIGYKAEGVIPISEFDKVPSVGDEVEAIVKRFSSDGTIVLSKLEVDMKKKLESIEKAMVTGEPVFGRIKERVKGGYKVDLGGYIAFLPGSQVDVKRIEDPDSIIGVESGFKVLDVKKDQKEVNIVVSRRAYLEEEEKKEKELFWNRLTEGKILEGTVKRITDFGAFVNLGPVDALLPLKNITWKKISHPSEVLREGQRVWVKVLSLDRENEKITVGMKQLTPDPWEDVSKKYPISSRVKGTVVEITDKGAVIEIDEGLYAFLPVSEISWTKRVKRVEDFVKVGDVVSVVVVDVVPEKRRMIVSLRKLEENPWERVEEKYPIGAVVEGKVKLVQPNRVIVELEEGVSAHLYPDDVFWSKRDRKLSELFKEGDKVKVKVLEVDSSRRFIKVGFKQLYPDPWEIFVASHKVGDVVKGRVTTIVSFGAFVEVAEGVEGLVHISQVAKEKPKSVEDVLKIGDEVTAVIVSIDEKERRLGLSIKEYEIMREKEELKGFVNNEGASGVRLSDILKKVIGGN